MGWICKHCGTENELNVSSCVACSTAASAAYLQSEAKADEREHKLYLRQVARKVAALMQDYKHLRQALMVLNIIAVVLVIACAAYTATLPDTVSSRNAKLLFSADALQHPGVATATYQANKLSQRLGRALPELEGQYYTFSRRLSTLRAPMTLDSAARQLTSAANRFAAPADDHVSTLAGNGRILLSRLQGAFSWVDVLQNIIAPDNDSP